MRTKESFLKNNGEAWEYTNTLRVVPYEDALIAMNEYAKEQSVAFGNWIAEHEWHILYGTNVWESFQYKEQYPTDHLYELFKFEQSNPPTNNKE